MSKEAVFAMALEPDLRAEFMAEAETAHRPVSQVILELMCELVRKLVQRQRDAREYDDFFRGKVEAGRVSMRAGDRRSNEEA